MGEILIGNASLTHLDLANTRLGSESCVMIGKCAVCAYVCVCVCVCVRPMVCKGMVMVCLCNRLLRNFLEIKQLDQGYLFWLGGARICLYTELCSSVLTHF